jgi:hypothetical protein
MGIREAIESNHFLKRIDRIAAFRVNPSGYWMQEALSCNSCLRDYDSSQSQNLVKRLYQRECCLDLMCDNLKNEAFLAELNPGENRIGDTGAGWMLQVIRLNENKIGNEGAKSIYEAIKYNKNTALHEIHFSENKFRPFYTSKVIDELMKRKGRIKLIVSGNSDTFECRFSFSFFQQFSDFK